MRALWLLVLWALVAPCLALASDLPRVPPQSAMYRLWVEQAVAEEWGLQASPARLAAQLHQESAWNPRARSHAGAQGLAQFMPATAQWIAQRFPERLGAYDPWDPRQAILAAAVYDRWLYDRNPAATECDRWAFALAGYNGGEGWLRRDQRLAAAAGDDPLRWWGNVERHTGRAGWAKRENRGYVHRILRQLEHAYVRAGWPGVPVCEVQA